MTYREIAEELLDTRKPVIGRDDAARRFLVALAELKDDPRWTVLRERAVARLGTIVRDIIYRAKDHAEVLLLAGEAKPLIEMLDGPALAAKTLERQRDEEQGQEDLERLGEP